MTTTDWLVIVGAVVLIVAVNWWFFIAGEPSKPSNGDGGAQ